jgi:hypothetical protein
MQRTARCHCGNLTVECSGEPEQIFMCHCEMCQRRTGTAFNLGAWFSRDDVRIAGAETTYQRSGELGALWTFHFCPTCGTSLYWTLESVFPGQLGVAVGCFADPAFPAPTLSFYGKRRHAWLTQPAGTPSHLGTLGSPLE